MTVKTYSDSKDGNKKLSEHFVVGEFACQDGSDKILHDDKLCPTMEKIISKYGCSKAIINSGYRTSSHDKAVGGSGSGQHTKGTAADVTFYDKNGNKMNHKQICCDLQDMGVPGIGYISSTAVHIDFRTDGKWWGDETNGKTVSDWYSYFGISKPSSKPIPTPTLQNGMYDNNEVRELQALIGATVDGDFGDKTESKLKEWQKKYGLTADGIYGEKTCAKMKEVY